MLFSLWRFFQASCNPRIWQTFLIYFHFSFWKCSFIRFKNLSKNILWGLSRVDVCVIKFQSTQLKMDLKYLILSSLISRSMKVLKIFDCIKLWFYQSKHRKVITYIGFYNTLSTSESIMVLVHNQLLLQLASLLL